MSKIPLAKLPQYIKHSEDFTGSSVTGGMEDGGYSVYSYSTIIARFSHGVLLWFDDTTFSNTTAKLQHLIRAEYMGGVPKTYKEHIL